MSTGQACRASVLTSACLVASGALRFATANSFVWGQPPLPVPLPLGEERVQRQQTPRLPRHASALAAGDQSIDIAVAFCYRINMSQPVKVSDALVLDARLTGEFAERSIAGQIEFWARLGRAIEPLLRGDKALALRRAGDAQPLSDCLNSVDSPAGRQRVGEHLNNLPYPHYEPADSPGLLVRIESNGKRTVGRFVNREFQAVKKAKR